MLAFQMAALGLISYALAEELLFRAYLLPRVERFVSDPVDALVIAALLFQLAHVPQSMSDGASLGGALVDRLGLLYPSGLVWGYLYQRTRSIWPGVIWHAATAEFGNLFFL